MTKLLDQDRCPSHATALRVAASRALLAAGVVGAGTMPARPR